MDLGLDGKRALVTGQGIGHHRSGPPGRWRSGSGPTAQAARRVKIGSSAEQRNRAGIPVVPTPRDT
jgi:hypothetical protein